MCSEPADLGVRVASGDGRLSYSTRRRSQASPASVARTARPTASALPAGPIFVGKKRIAAADLASGRGVSCPLVVSEAPQWPQKRFSGRFSCRHSGQEVSSSIYIFSLFSPNLFTKRKVFKHKSRSPLHPGFSVRSAQTGIGVVSCQAHSVCSNRAATRANIVKPQEKYYAKNMYICRIFANSRNPQKPIVLTSHGRGRWFETSIAHFGVSGLYARIVGLYFGPVAQLGERCLRMAEVTSSSLVGSTPAIPAGNREVPPKGKDRSVSPALSTPTHH